MHMNRDYIHWLESLPCSRGIRDRQVNVWMSGYAPLPDEIDLEHSREMQGDGECGTALMACWESFGGVFGVISDQRDRLLQ